MRSDERTLQAGYELGRRAVAEDLSELDLAAIHHDGLRSSIKLVAEQAAAEMIDAGGAFLQEVLASYEMVRRGYKEAAAIAAAERRQTAMLHQLSSFLADTSLTARDTDALAEVVSLVAEHARELTNASQCVASCTLDDQEVRATASDKEHAETPGATGPHALELGPSATPRSQRDEAGTRSALHHDTATANVLNVPITALDGRPLGSIQLSGKRQGDFTERDEAIAIHLANMTAASLERALLYRTRAPNPE